MRRDRLLVTLIALCVGVFMAANIRQPAYTDAYYYYNAAHRLASGLGLTDAALWTYFGNPQSLPAPSHLYWMPLASILQGVSMAVFGANFHAAQVPLVACYVMIVLLAFQVGWWLGGTRRAAWLSAILATFSGFFMAYWAMSDTFAVYGAVGAACLVCIGLGRRDGGLKWWAAAGALSALAHLTRADGVLLTIVAVGVAGWPRTTPPPKSPHPISGEGDFQTSDSPSPLAERGAGGEVKFRAVLAILVCYLLVMAPWFVRNLTAVGTILPVGGFQTAYMRDYAELVNYPAGVTLADFLSQGIGAILAGRWDALVGSVGTLRTFISVEGMIIMTPLMLIGLWRRRFDPLLSGFALYAVGLHLAMTLIFALPGTRGGLFHSAAALVPFWAACGAVGMEDCVTWIARRRRWPQRQAVSVFSVALGLFAVVFSGWLFTLSARGFNAAGDAYRKIGERLPENAVVIVNDPSAFYYHTGRMGVVLPNAPPTVIPELARRFGVTHLILDENRTAPMDDLYTQAAVPPFLKLLYTENETFIYEVIR